VNGSRGVVDGGIGDASDVGDAFRGLTRAGELQWRLDAHLGVVERATVAPIDLRDGVVPGVRAGRPNCVHHRLRPGVSETYGVKSGHAVVVVLGVRNLGPCRAAGGVARADGFDCRFDHLEDGVAVDQRRDLVDEVEVLVASTSVT
jgi:hypothetical protein